MVDVTGLTQPTSASDTAHQVKVNVGTRPARIAILGAGPDRHAVRSLVDRPDRDRRSATADYELKKRNTFLDITHSFDDVLEVTEDLVFPGRNITLEAGTVKVLGHRSTRARTSATAATSRSSPSTSSSTAARCSTPGPLITGTGTTATSGTITLIASEVAQLSLLGILNLDLLDTDVTIGDAPRSTAAR